MSNLRPFALQTPRLLIRRFLLGEVDDFVRYRNDPYILQLHPWLSPLSQAEAWAFFTRQVTATPGTPNSQVHAAVVNQQASQLMGDCFFRIDPSGRTAEVGLMLGQAWHGNGFEAEALRVLVYWACVAGDGPRLQRLTGMVDIRNTGLTNAFKAAGFTKVTQGTAGGKWPYFVMQYSV